MDFAGLLYNDNILAFIGFLRVWNRYGPYRTFPDRKPVDLAGLFTRKK